MHYDIEARHRPAGSGTGAVLFAVVVKVWIAAADDPELHERLVPLERRLARVIAAAIPEIVGDREVPSDLGARVTVVLAALRGLALSQAYEPAARQPKDPWPDVRPILERLLLQD